MAQVRIIRRSGEYFREYAIDPGDKLIDICSRFGHRDWRRVYYHPENAAFRTRFPDPNQIDFVNSVNLFIPLVGASGGGASARGKPGGDYMIARIRDGAGVPLVRTTLRLIAPGQPHEGWDIETSADGDIILTDPIPGAWHLSSAYYELMPATMGSSHYLVEDMATVRKAGSLPDPTYDFPLTRNGIDDIVARWVFYIVCPMCGVTFKTVKPAAGSHNLCPNDGFDLTTIEQTIEAEKTSFLKPPKDPQNPQKTPTNLKCRGAHTLSTIHGTVTLYWDESRFALPNQGNYTLWARPPSGTPGTPKKARIIGRTTWVARDPDFTLVNNEPRIYEFHATPIGASPPYRTFSIPSNEKAQLTNVLKWVTVHHTGQSTLTGTDVPQDLQVYHQDVGIGGKKDQRAADIAYHFVIDTEGSIYEGRPLGIKGSQVEKFNGGNVGIVMAGNYQPRDFSHWPPATDPDIKPTQAALTALDNLIDVLSRRFDLKSVWSHRERKKQSLGADAWTYCPGDNLIPHVNLLRMKYPGPPP